MIMQDKNNLQIADLILQVDRRARQQAKRGEQVSRVRSTGAFTATTSVGIATGALLLAFTAARPLAVQSAPRLALELEDYAALPITADNTDAEHARTARPSQLPAGRTGRPPFLRQRSQRAAVHPRQANESVHEVSRLQWSRRPAGPVPEVHVRAELRDRAHQRHPRSRLCAGMACSTPFTWKTRRRPGPPRRGAGSCQDSICPDTRRRRPCRRRPSTGRSIARSCSSSGRIGTSRMPRSKARPGSSCACSIRWRRIRWAR